MFSALFSDAKIFASWRTHINYLISHGKHLDLTFCFVEFKSCFMSNNNDSTIIYFFSISCHLTFTLVLIVFINYALMNMLIHKYLIPCLIFFLYIMSLKVRFLGTAIIFDLLHIWEYFSFSPRKYDWVYFLEQYVFPSKFYRHFSIRFYCFMLQERSWKPVHL